MHRLSLTSPRTLALLTAFAPALACAGDDGAATDTSNTSVNPTTTAASTTTASSTSASTTASSSETGTGTGTDSDSSTSDTDATTSDTGVTSTTAATTSTTDPTTSTTDACVCTPGEPTGECEGDDLQVCADDCLGVTAKPCGGGQTCKGGECSSLLCIPNSKACEDANSYKVCDSEGGSYGEAIPCAPTEGCDSGACLPLCDLIQSNPSSIGCSFFANRMDNFNASQNDSVVVGNISKSTPAQVQLYFTPNGTNTEQAQGAPVNIPPGGTTTFTLTNPPMDKVSQLRKGGSYRVQSNIPTIAYQHSPIGQVATNDASMLLPEHALKQNYIIASWRDVHSAYPSYFNGNRDRGQHRRQVDPARRHRRRRWRACGQRQPDRRGHDEPLRHLAGARPQRR